MKTPEDEEFERIEREQAERERAMGWRKRQIEELKEKRERCPTCDRAWPKENESND